MARPLRIQYPGAVYHVTCRGIERKSIYKDDKDRKTFLEILVTSGKIYNIKIYSYVLMSNHFHLLIETPFGNLGEFMRHFNITYTRNYNVRHKRAGNLYQGRYKSILVDKESYMSMLSRYIHLNPVKIKSMKGRAEKEKKQYLRKYKWSGLPGYIDQRKVQDFIDYTFVLEEYGGDNKNGRAAYRDRIYNEISIKQDIKGEIIGQSILGTDKFIEWISEKYLRGTTDKRESPALKALQRYQAEDKIIKVIEKETGEKINAIKKQRGSLRQIVMDVLYRFGGLKGVEIGTILGVDYSTVSKGRKQKRKKLQKDRELRHVLSTIQTRLSI